MNSLRKLGHRFGLDIHRYRSVPDKLAWLKQANIKTVLDIGANTGQFATEIRGVLPDVKLYSFEPLRECFDILSNTFKNDSNFKAFNFALGEKEQEIEMNKSEYAPSSSILPMAEIHKNLFPHTQNHSAEKIHIKKLDDVAKELHLEKEILIKVDVQGFEDKVIEGGLETFKIAKTILIENSFVELYEDQPLFDNIYQKLKSLGFAYKGSVQQKLNKQTGEIISEDSLFVK